MNTQKHTKKLWDAQLVDGLTGGAADTPEDVVPAVRGCEVIEYDELTGEQEWSDTLLVQDFTDSVLSTTPAPLGGE